MIQVDWEAFSVYLFTVKKYDTSNTSALKGRFRCICTYFTNRDYTKNNLYQFFAYLQNERHFTNGTLNNYIKLIKHLNAYLDKEELLKDFTYFKETPPYIETLTSEEAKCFIECAYRLGYRWGLMVETFLTTGLRCQELCNLTWDDVKEDRFILRDTKSGSVQFVYLLPQLSDKMKKLVHYPHNFVFGGNRGKLFGHKLNSKLEKIAKMARIGKHITAHILRHTAATLAVSYDMNAFTIQKFMRHKDISTTMRYVHNSLSDVIPIAESLSPMSVTAKTVVSRIKRFYKTLLIYPYKIEFAENAEQVTLTMRKFA